MAENVQQSIEVPVGLELFGSLVTEMSPSDLPEGISPDNQDVVYLPGGVGSRPGMRKIYHNLPANTTITYEKTFTPPNGQPLNMILASNGAFYTEDPTNSPGTLTQIAQVAPGSYCNSISAFGRELFTFHNGLFGTDIPRTFDGTFFDRATQDGPGVNVTVQAFDIPGVVLGNSASVTPEAIISSISIRHMAIWTGITYMTAVPCLFTVGQQVTITGNSNALSNGTFTLVNVFTIPVNGFNGFGVSYVGAVNPGGLGGLATPVTGGNTLTRINNQVIAYTTTPHGLQIGNQVAISEAGSSVVGGTITSIEINNEDSPGLALITTTSPHGLQPQNQVSLVGVGNTAVGSISTINTLGSIVTVEMGATHNLSVGSSVNVSGSGASPNYTDGQWVVVAVPTPTSFTYAIEGLNSAGTTDTGGSVDLSWPFNVAGLGDNLFTVTSAPSNTTFYVSVQYVDGSWSGGTVSFAWDGTFYVTSIPTTLSFTYQQYGPDTFTATAGRETPFGQMSPGLHSVLVLFLTRNGLITAPSPPSQPFVMDGGAYLLVTNIPIGPPNVIARILAFTGANGSSFFYIPEPGQVNGLVVSTSTVVNDNTSTSMVVDFSDPTLFASISIDIPGSDFFNMQKIGPALSVASYASRAAWFGMRNSITNLLNTGFDGGTGTIPPGWSLGNGSGGGSLIPGLNGFGFAWSMLGDGTLNNRGSISQPAFEDGYSVAILQPSTTYAVNLWLSTVGILGIPSGTITVDLFSQSAGLLSSAVLPATAISNVGRFYQVQFDTETPTVIPSDTVIRLYIHGVPTGDTVVADEIEIYSIANPFSNTFLWSYINFPESLDGVTGRLGTTDDSTLIQSTFTYRDAFLYLTQSGLHETNDSPGEEPSGWVIRQVSDHCGSCSPRSCSSGENFSVWMTSPSVQPPVGRGLYIYTGGSIFKLSQEIQPDFDAINSASEQCIWVKNDTITRRIYVGVPIGNATAPNRIYVLDYRELDVASQLANNGPIHVSFTGKMVCSDLSRKWTRWSIAANFGEIIIVPGQGTRFVVGGGNGQTPGASPGFANTYWFDETLLTDDDYGMIVPYYTTYFFVNHDAEQQLQVGFHRKLFKRYSSYITGVGMFKITPLANTLANPWPSPPLWPLNPVQFYDIGDGMNVTTERCAFKFGSQPAAGQTDNSFNMGKLIITLQQEAISPIRFGAV